MQELIDLLARRRKDVPLDVAALQLATIEYPEISVEPFLVLLDSYATELGERIPAGADGSEFIELMNEYLVDELGFEGNSQDYYSPANSCLNEVLTKRTGIPITLSILYMEIARRLNRTMHGVGLPGHFLVKYEDKDFSVFIDAFNGGQLLFNTECFDLARKVTGMDIAEDDRILEPVSNRHILIRMLNNMRAVYFRQQNPAKALKVLDLLITADEGSAEEYKQRAFCRTQLNLFKGARSDLETYLKLAPQAQDRGEVEQQLAELKKWLATLN